jgi:hypothetical protein
LRTRLIYLALIATSLSVALALIEIGLRLAGVAVPISEPVRTPQPELYEADANVGYRLRPFLRTTYHYPQASKESIPIVSNSDGFRSSREFDEPDPRRRIGLRINSSASSRNGESTTWE